MKITRSQYDVWLRAYNWQSKFLSMGKHAVVFFKEQLGPCSILSDRLEAADDIEAERLLNQCIIKETSNGQEASSAQVSDNGNDQRMVLDR